jgi:hypothetical protein
MLTALSTRIPRPSVALVVAFVALFTALGGTGYAALKITGKDIVDGSLGKKEVKKNSLDGSRIKESSLGTVPSAATAANADAVGGIPAGQLMTKKVRAASAPIPTATNFANDAIIGTLPDLQPGTWVVTAVLTYDNDGAVENESCTLEVPGDDASTSFAANNTETLSIQQVVEAGAVFTPNVRCTSDGNDDTYGTGNIIAVRVD